MTMVRDRFVDVSEGCKVGSAGLMLVVFSCRGDRWGDIRNLAVSRGVVSNGVPGIDCDDCISHTSALGFLCTGVCGTIDVALLSVT